MDRLKHLMLELVKVNKHFHLLKSAFHLQAAGNRDKDGTRQNKLGGAQMKKKISVALQFSKKSV